MKGVGAGGEGEGGGFQRLKRDSVPWGAAGPEEGPARVGPPPRPPVHLKIERPLRGSEEAGGVPPRAPGDGRWLNAVRRGRGSTRSAASAV